MSEFIERDSRWLPLLGVLSIRDVALGGIELTNCSMACTQFENLVRFAFIEATDSLSSAATINVDRCANKTHSSRRLDNESDAKQAFRINIPNRRFYDSTNATNRRNVKLDMTHAHVHVDDTACARAHTQTDT